MKSIRHAISVLCTMVRHSGCTVAKHKAAFNIASISLTISFRDSLPAQMA